MSSFSSIHKRENSEKSLVHGSTPSVPSGPPPAHGASQAKPLVLMSDHRTVTPDNHTPRGPGTTTPTPTPTATPFTSSTLWSPAASLSSKHLPSLNHHHSPSPQHLVQPLPPPSHSSSSHVQMRGSPLDPLMSRPSSSSSSSSTSSSKLDGKSSAPPKAHQGSVVTVHPQGPSSSHTFSHMYLPPAAATSVLRSSSNTAHQSSSSSSSSASSSSSNSRTRAADPPLGKESISCFKGNNHNNNNNNNNSSSTSKSNEPTQSLKQTPVTSLSYLPSSIHHTIQHTAISGYTPQVNGHRIGSIVRANGHTTPSNSNNNNGNHHFNSAVTKSNFMSVDSLISKGDSITNTHSTTSSASITQRGQEVVTNCLPPSNVRQVESPLGQVIPQHWANNPKSTYPYASMGIPSAFYHHQPLPPNINIMSALQAIPTNQPPNMLPPAAHSRSPAVHHQQAQQQHQQQQHHQQQQQQHQQAISSKNSQTNENVTFNHSKHNTNGSSNSPNRHHSKVSVKEGDHKRQKTDESIHNWSNTSGGNVGVVRHSSGVIHETKNHQQQQSSVNHSSKSTPLVSSVSDASQFPCAPFDSHNSGSGTSSSSSSSASTSAVTCSSSTRQSSSSSSSSTTTAPCSSSSSPHANASSVTLVQHLQPSTHMETAQLNHHNSSKSNSGNLHHPVMYGLSNSGHRLLHVPPGHPAYRPQPLPGLSTFPIVNMPEPSGHCDTSSALPLTSKEGTPRVLHCTSNSSDFKVAVTSSTTTKVTVTGTTANKEPTNLVNENSSECLLPQPPSSISPTNSTTSSNSSSSGGAKFHKKAWVQKYQDTTTQDSSNINSTVVKVKVENTADTCSKSSPLAAGGSSTCNGSSLNLTKNGYNSLHGDSKVNGKSSTISSATTVTPTTSTAETATTSATATTATAATTTTTTATPSTTATVAANSTASCIVKSEKVDQLVNSKKSATGATTSNDGHGDHKSDHSSPVSHSSSSKKCPPVRGAAAAKSTSESVRSATKVNKKLKTAQNKSVSDEDMKPSTGSKAACSSKRKMTKEIDSDLTDEDVANSDSQAPATTVATSVNKKRGPKYKKSSNASNLSATEEESNNKTSDSKCNSNSSSNKVSTSAKASTKGSTKQSKKSKRSTSPDVPSSSSTCSSSSTYTTGEAFLQDKSCSELGTSKSGAKQISRCIECNMTPKQKAKKEVAPSVFCRFYQFRKLVYVSPKEPRAAGFSEPKDAEEKDVSLWMPPKCIQNDSSGNEEILKLDEAKFLIEFVGDHFCKLVEQEALAMSLHMGSTKIAWKSVVAGVREMCDVCATTLFNIHWFCSDCGFVVCIDCYRARKEIESGHHLPPTPDSLVPKATDGHEKDKDKFGWLLCNSKDAHSQVNLVLTQIIAKSALWDVCKLLHYIRRKHFKSECKCGLDEVIETLTYSSSPSSKASSLTSAAANIIDVTPSKDNLSDCNHEQVSGNNSTNNNSTNSNSHKGTLNATANCNALNTTTAATTASSLASTTPCNNNNSNNSGSNVTSPLSILADVAINAEKRESSTDGVIRCPSGAASSIDSVVTCKPVNAKTTEEDENSYIFTRLRQLLQNSAIAHAANGVKCGTQCNPLSSSSSVNASTTSSVTSSSNSNSSSSNSANSSAPSSVTGKKTKGKKIVLSSTQLNGVIKCDNNSGNGTCEESSLKYFKRQINPIFTSKNLPSRVCVTKDTGKEYPGIEHDWFCNGKLLVLKDTGNEKNLELFQQQWIRHQPVLVCKVHEWLEQHLWTPKVFKAKYADTKTDLINTETGEKVKCELKLYWDGFENLKNRKKDKESNDMILKLKDWPPGEEFADALPEQFRDLISCIPMPEYTTHEGSRNLAGRFPRSFGLVPDLGPKMYTAYGLASDTNGTTNLHLDMSDAVNVMVYVARLKSKDDERNHQKNVIKALSEANVDDVQIKRMKEKKEKPGALWHIYDARDADKIRDMLNGHALKNGKKLLANADPIHDQSYYLDKSLRQKLKDEYKVEGYTIVQYWGDAVFIPAGAPHQVRNLSSCIKVAEDFVSPENVAHCFNLTEEFRQLSPVHANHEDKLQIKNIIYHAVKDALASFPV